MGSSALEQTRRAARLDEVIRGMLPATQERDRLGRRRTLACLHPTDRSRASVSTPQERPGHEARLAPEGTSRTSPYPRLLSCLCSLVDVVLPTRAGVSIRKRCVSRPTEHQAILLQRLGLQIPAHIELAEM